MIPWAYDLANITTEDLVGETVCYLNRDHPFVFDGMVTDAPVRVYHAVWLDAPGRAGSQALVAVTAQVSLFWGVRLQRQVSEDLCQQKG